MTVPLFFVWKRGSRGPEPQLVFDYVTASDRKDAIGDPIPVPDSIVGPYLRVGCDRTFASAVLAACIEHFPKPDQQEEAA